jgi:hypothetical protein
MRALGAGHRRIVVPWLLATVICVIGEVDTNKVAVSLDCSSESSFPDLINELIEISHEPVDPKHSFSASECVNLVICKSNDIADGDRFIISRKHQRLNVSYCFVFGRRGEYGLKFTQHTFDTNGPYLQVRASDIPNHNRWEIICIGNDRAGSGSGFQRFQFPPFQTENGRLNGDLRRACSIAASCKL